MEDAFEWYLLRSRHAAEAFLHDLDHAATLISESPEVWPRYERETHRYILRRFPFDVIYREAGAAIEIVAVAHHKRRPGYWHERSAG